ncbi:hypothetical protein GGF43_005302 [Coemansia sp. RSA 2618]|nr:hypothetical protein GGF43_005302 [Coemansia sp. RSA 2618]
MSTTTAEASALSILKDTDLAYPTPQRPSYGGPELFGSSSAFTRTPSLQPPTEPHAAYSNTLHRAHLPLSNIFARSLDVIEPPARTAHGRYASADKRASSSGWLESSYVPQRLSMGSSTIVGIESERNSCDLDRDLDRNDGGSFLARTASPAEQPQDLFSSGVLGVHSFPGVSAAPAAHRPLVEPIGAPSRRRCGPSLGALSTRSHDHLPFDDVRQPMYTKNRPTQSTGTRSCRTSMDHDIVSSPPVDNSLYQRRSFWEHDSADIQK